MSTPFSVYSATSVITPSTSLRPGPRSRHAHADYTNYYQGKSKEEAYKEMKYYGFKDSWTLAGLKNYFEKHSQQPVNQYVPRCSKTTVNSWINKRRRFAGKRYRRFR